MAKKTAVQFYYDYFEQLAELDDKQFRKIIEAMIVYDNTGNIIELDSVTKMAFNFIKRRIDYDKEKYNLICERNKENGEKGGRPKNPDKPKKPSGLFRNPKNPEKPKKPDMDMDIDMDIDNNNITTTEIYDYISNNYNRMLSASEIEKIQLWLSEFNEDMIKKAIDISCLQNIKTFSYAEGILKNWKGKGYKTIGDLQNEEKMYNNEPKKTKTGGFQL